MLHKDPKINTIFFAFGSTCLLFIFLLEYTITMYDTKSRELRWNATYSDYASTLPDDDTKYSKSLGHWLFFVD